ncbi:hypothetical protein FOH10_29375 [Nocardia otitidiscaviarum]|uniref:Uncharacterized protein n=1 Tax=Nocardia otitidiscaviarum TaxID=1823 RepID=A0A516NTL0_9NOCA|nr:hypothetical protein [Nocardia otitidiscaviarum]MCP9621565.1 hypothetical protein [Nocardia otitidiscaviarum]QDP82233.1 hypothetical protein FOH10_29375 [Nocardia otitidiscaviarum]
MFGFVKLGFDLLIGDLKWFAIGGLVLLMIAAFAWDAISTAISRLMGTSRKPPEHAEPQQQPSPSRRTARTRDRRAARDAERRAALRAKHADSSPVHADQSTEIPDEIADVRNCR